MQRTESKGDNKTKISLFESTWTARTRGSLRSSPVGSENAFKPEPCHFGSCKAGRRQSETEKRSGGQVSPTALGRNYLYRVILRLRNFCHLYALWLSSSYQEDHAATAVGFRVSGENITTRPGDYKYKSSTGLGICKNFLYSFSSNTRDSSSQFIPHTHVAT